jgi:hypothetical protein
MILFRHRAFLNDNLSGSTIQVAREMMVGQRQGTQGRQDDGDGLEQGE